MCFICYILPPWKNDGNTIITSTSATSCQFLKHILPAGAEFSLRSLGFGDALPSHVATYRSEMGMPHRDYSVSVGSDPDTETDGVMSPEHAVRLWGRSNTKSGRSSCLSSRANSNLTLTDTEHENTENGRVPPRPPSLPTRPCGCDLDVDM